MKRIFVVLLALVAIIVFATSAHANVMVYGLGVNPGKSMKTVDFYYRLNESADNGVTIEVYDSGDNLIRTITNAPNARGLNAVTWDGKDDQGNNVPAGDYYFTVTASDDGHTDWDMISVDGPGNIMYSGKGLAVNKNPNSPHYGKVYILNTIDGTSGNTGAVEQLDGVFTFWAHGTPIPEESYIDTMIWWPNSTDPYGASPWWLTIGPDDHIYVGSWKDGNETVYEFDPYFTTKIKILTEEDLTNHGNVCGLAVLGTGADRVLYTVDEDLEPAWSIWKYEIGEGPFPWTAMPTLFIEGITNTHTRQLFNMVFTANAETLFTSDYVSAAPPPGYTLANLCKWDVTTTPPTLIWEKLQTEEYRWICGIDYDDGHGRLAAATRIGKIFIFNSAGDSIAVIENSGSNRGCAFDAVGNLYVVNSSIEWWRVWSPPDGPNTSTTKSPFMFKIGVVGVSEYVNVPKAITAKNIPNPFSLETEIVYSIPSKSYCSVKIYDVSGKLVRNLVNGMFEPGCYRVRWDGTNDAGMRLASGIYFYRVSAGNLAVTKEVILVR